MQSEWKTHWASYVVGAGLCLSAAQFISCVSDSGSDSGKPEETCVYRNEQVSCEEARRRQQAELDAFNEFYASQERARKADSIAFVKAQASIIPVVPAKPLGGMAEIPAGSYKRADGKTVTVRPFNMSNTELTHGAFSKMTNAAAPAGDAAQLPAAISWKGIILALNAASLAGRMDSVYSYKKDPAGGILWDSLKTDFRKNGYRLPTEAEWEYAARGGTATKFYWGDTSTDSVARNFAWTAYNAAKPRPVAGRVPNQYGLFDMLGNAWELTQESIRDKNDPAQMAEYPGAAMDFHVLSTAGNFCLAKGGGYRDSLGKLSFDFRYPVSKDSGHPDVTARIAQTRVPDGLVEDFYPNGKIRSRREYKNGAIAGIRETYFPNGDVLKEDFSGSVAASRRFDSTGALVVLTVLTGLSNDHVQRSTFKLTGADSIQEGPYQVWYKDTILVESGNYIQGKRHGMFYRYRTNGMIMEETPYVDDQIQGLRSTYDQWGHLQLRTPFVKGREEGIQLGWDYPEGSWKPRHNTETLWKTVVATAETQWKSHIQYPIVNITYAADDSTVLEKMAGPKSPNFHYILSYYPEGAIRGYSGRIDTALAGTAVYPEWYPSGALKRVYRVVQYNAVINPYNYTVAFSESGECIENCAKVAIGLDVAAFKRPVDLEDQFYRGVNLSIAGLLANSFPR